MKLIKATRLNFTLEVLEFGGLEAVHLPFGSNWEGINRTEMDLKVLTLTRPSNLISKWDLIIAIAIRVSRLIQILDLPKELQVLTLECVLGRVFDDECRFAIISRLACIDSVLVDKDSGFTAQRFIRNCF